LVLAVTTEPHGRARGAAEAGTAIAALSANAAIPGTAIERLRRVLIGSPLVVVKWAHARGTAASRNGAKVARADGKIHQISRPARPTIQVHEPSRLRRARVSGVLAVGAAAPSFTLPDADTGEAVTDPWQGGRTVIAFFKVTCPVCKMVAPKLTALAEGGARVVAVGEDPPAALQRYAREEGQQVPTVSEASPYAVSDAYGISTVPTLYLVEPDGTVAEAVGGWDRSRWNAVAGACGAPAISDETDSLPVFRPG